jgi:PHD/YefM family antitoxin component YafN of YafNO toxin-antitoxin module
MHPEYVVDKKARKKAVLVSFNEWQRLMEAIEELDDIRAYDRAKQESDDLVPFEEAVRQIKAKR